MKRFNRPNPLFSFFKRDLRNVYNLSEFFPHFSYIMNHIIFYIIQERILGTMKQKLAAFFRGRYGSDALAKGMLILYLILAVIMLFVGNTLRLILNLISFALCFFMFYRMLSKNKIKREQENQTYLHIRRNINKWFMLNQNKWKYRKTHIYKKCPHCKAQIRLPRIIGEHHCTCPKCGNSFGVRIK